MDKSSDVRSKIMIVDDVDTNISILVQMIESIGYDTVVAQSVDEAMAQIENNLPDLILSDISMPGKDGYEFCRMIKENYRTADIPVIFLSAMDKWNEKEKGYQAGAIDFITKPYYLGEIRIKINEHLQFCEMRKELEKRNRDLHLLVKEKIKKIEEDKKNILYALAKAATISDDPGSGSHLDNVAKNSRFLAQSLSFSPAFEGKITSDFVDTIEVAALLHDIGKIGISGIDVSEVDAVAEEDRDKKALHTIKGAALLEEIYTSCGQNEYVKMAIEIAKYHHERWDGTGYPNGIEGKDIPLTARIVGLVGMYDSMVNGRRGKAPVSRGMVVKLIEKEAGKRFDPNIVEVFTKVEKQFAGAPKEDGT